MASESETTSIVSSSSPDLRIRDVWMDTFREELNIMRNLLPIFDHIVVVVKHAGNLKGKEENMQNNYNLMKNTVDVLPPIQVGFSFFDKDGNQPDLHFSTWQFNLKLNYNSKLLIRNLASSGIDFEKHCRDGIDHGQFVEQLVLYEFISTVQITWIGYNSMNDFGYLIRILTGYYLPDEQEEFLQLVNHNFSIVYDLRHLLILCKDVYTLDQLSSMFNVTREGPKFSAGYDCKYIGACFFSVVGHYFDNILDDTHRGRIFHLSPHVNF